MPSKNRNIGVDCGNCSKRLLPAKFVCFFWKAKNEVYISVKNQFKVAAMASLYIEKVGAKDEVRCQFCNASVGVQLPFGPHGSNYISLGKKKVIVGGIQCEPNDKVSQKLIPRLKKQIDEVNMDTFYGRSIVPDFGNWSSLIARQVPVQFASPSAPEHFDWSDLLVSDKVPRTYQLEAFVEALQRDLVLVLPTGSGKTLVAALLLARMRALNPGRMGALLVERVPLVFQQAKALEADTGLKVAALCGEIMTSWKIRELLDGAHDLVVITAGALLSLITNRRIPDLSAFSCIVIDECHHASSPRHNFPRVLKLNHQLPEDMRPRLLGLTASPVEPGDGDSEGQKKLRRLLSFFSPDCVAFRPAKAEESAVQTQRKTEPWPTDRESMPVPSNRLRMLAGQLRGFIYSGLPQFRNNREEIRDLLCLLAAMEASQLVGVSKAAPFLDDLRCISTATMRFRSDPNWQLDVSERMRVVEAEAASLLQVENKESRLLVLTWTRRTARLLHARLSELFPNLRPQLVVGRGGADGMDWDGEQSVAIDSFNDGSSRLIVSTAVLEEGLDVSACDVVIRFDAAKSLVQLLQSRGRARKKDSRFLMVVDENEAAAATDLSERENMLNRVVDDHSLENGVPSELTRQMVKHLAERKSPVQAARSVVAHYSMGLTGKMGGQIMVQLCCPELQRKDCDKEALMLSIEKENFVKVRSIDLLFDQCENHSLPSGLFPRDSTVAAVYLETHSTLDSPLGIYHEFARRWSFELNNKPIYAMPDVRKVEDSDDDSIKKSERTVQTLSSVAIGQFQTKTKELSVRDKAEFQCRWQMQALIDSRRFLITQESAAGIENRIAAAAQADSELDNDCPTNLIKLANALLTLSATGDGDAFFEDVLGDRLNSALSVLEVTDEDAEDAAVGPPVACGSLLVKRVAVTPTRVVLFPATPVASSRLLRRIPPERLVMVAFTDESCGVVRGGGVNVASAASVGARFTKVLRDGLTLAGRMYRFFSASSGQLRTSRCFFVAAESVEEVQRLRDQLVENPTEFRSVSKYLSRLGLFHTADTWVAKLETNQVSKCIDHRALNDDLLTDGSGKISSELAMSIKSKLDLPELPFAFQFRFGGAKGVLTTVSDKDPNLGLQQGILLRPSTVKFKSSDTNLCIVGTSQCGRLCLNREIITLLEALASKCDSWNPSQRLRNILDAELRKIAESLATPSAATAALREFIDKPSLATASVVEAARHFNFLTDPHWLGLLRCVFRFRLSDLQKRAALPVGDLGCRVMGAPDPLEVLAEG
uniref:RNA-dependent RNA polymerase n=1 Tax=Macrostomum lignano TaxID=282301 RepID=A0A1I8HJL9_9PLAT